MKSMKSMKEKNYEKIASEIMKGNEGNESSEGNEGNEGNESNEDNEADLQKDASSMSTAPETFWPMWKSGSGNINCFNNKKEINEENDLKCGNQTK